MATKESTVVPSSHSYANVVLNPNDPQIQKQQLTKGINENKENISAEKTKNVKTQQEAPKEEQQQQHQQQPQQHQQSEVVDEVGFIPVISSNKKDKKTRQSEQEIRREQRGAGKSSGKSSQDRPDKPRRNRRERKEQKDKAAAGGAAIVEAKEKDKADDDSSANADSSDGQNDKIKFVEAPLPKVNAWNVSRHKIIQYHNIRCKCILVFIQVSTSAVIPASLSEPIANIEKRILQPKVEKKSVISKQQPGK